MHPVLFKIEGVTVYSYGFLIALGTLAGVLYMARQGKKELALTFDQANSLFLIIFLAALVGGKVFLFFEDPSFYTDHPAKLFAGRGFVFYGSFLFAVPAMLSYFRKNKLPAYQMLDVMAITTCLVHVFGRVGCFLAGCCYGKSTHSIFGVIYSDEACYAQPLGEPLHPTQLYEAAYIFSIMCFLFWYRSRKRFHGQLFFLYLLLYAVGRFVLEYLRGDDERGLLISGFLSHSQLVALLIFLFVLVLYWRRTGGLKSFSV